MATGRIVKRTARGFAATFASVVATIVGLVVVVLALVLLVPPLSQLVLKRAVSWYDGRVPGSISIGEIEGSIAGRLHLVDVVVADGEGHPLVEVDTLALDLDLWPLFTKTVDVEELLVRGTTVHTWENAPGWADLQMPEKQPKPKKEPGLDLPVGIEAHAQLEDIDVIAHAGAEETPLVLDAGLALRAEAEGTQASVELIEAQAQVPGQDLVLEDLSGHVTMHDTLVAVADLRLETNQGAAQVPSARWDIEQQTGAANLQAELDADALEQRLGIELTQNPALELSVHGGAELANVDLRLDAGPILFNFIN